MTTPVQWVIQFIFCGFLLVVSQVTFANPANCDPDMTEGQRFQSELCASHLGCRFVMSIQDSCVGVKSFLSRLGLGSRSQSGPVTDARIEQALIDLGVPQPKLADCTFRFDRSLCRQYLGLEQSAKPERPAEPEKLTPQNALYALSSALIEEQLRAKAGGGAYYDAKSSLQACAYSQQQSDRNEICSQAQREVDKCNAYRDGWYARKARLLKEAPGLGIGDRFPAVPAMELVPCPYTLPNSWMTPAQAIAEWEKGGKSNDSFIARCDGMRRSLSEALDSNDRERATAVVIAFEADCGKARQTYADIAAGARTRIASMKPASGEASASPDEGAPLPRRGSSALTAMFEKSIQQANVIAREREDLEARRRAEALEQERLQRVAAQRAADAARLGSAPEPAGGGMLSASSASLAATSGQVVSGVSIPPGTTCRDLAAASERIAQEDVDKVQYKRVQSAVPIQAHALAVTNWRYQLLSSFSPCNAEPRLLQTAREVVESGRRWCEGSRINSNCSTGVFAVLDSSQLSAALSSALSSRPGNRSAGAAGSSSACEPEVRRLEAELQQGVERAQGSAALYALVASGLRRLSAAWQPCNPQMAQELATRAAASQRSCEQLSTSAAGCR